VCGECVDQIKQVYAFSIVCIGSPSFHYILTLQGALIKPFINFYTNTS